MMDKLIKLLETKKTTLFAMLSALLLYFADGNTAAALTNDWGIPADNSLKLVSISKFLLVILAGSGMSILPAKKTDAGE